MKHLFEIKNGVGSVVDIDTEKRRVIGYLANFGSLDSHNDIIENGAFNKTIQERADEIMFLYQHDWTRPHGFFEELNPDDMGLKFVSQPLPNTTYSNDSIELYDAGIIRDHSIGFIPVKWDYDSDEQIRTIKEVKLYEGSNVTIGANRNTPYLGRKGMTIEQINDQSDRIVKMLRNGTLTDETFIQLEIALKQLQMESYRRGQTDAQTPPAKGATGSPQNVDDATAIKIFVESLKN